MKLLKNRSNRLLFLAMLSATAFFLHASGILPMDLLPSMSFSGCAATPTRVAVLKDIGELPPVDHLILEKQKRTKTKQVRIERGYLIRVTYSVAEDRYESMGPVAFLGVDPATSTLGLLSESGQKLSIGSADISAIVLVIENHPGRAVGWTALGAIGGAGVGAGIGAIADQDGFGAAFGTCATGPASLAGLGVGLARAGFDFNYRIGEGKWQIVIPPAEPEAVEDREPSPDTPPALEEDAGAASEVDADAGADPEADAGTIPELPGDAIPDPEVETNPDTGVDVGSRGDR